MFVFEIKSKIQKGKAGMFFDILSLEFILKGSDLDAKVLEKWKS